MVLLFDPELTLYDLKNQPLSTKNITLELFDNIVYHKSELDRIKIISYVSKVFFGIIWIAAFVLNSFCSSIFLDVTMNI